MRGDTPESRMCGGREDIYSLLPDCSSITTYDYKRPIVILSSLPQDALCSQELAREEAPTPNSWTPSTWSQVLSFKVLVFYSLHKR